ncbi:hypothetical protein [Peribacillus sp. SCS-155]|uniref:hypothetical protein n=1 Tax=Peribacillus sedimenti TaxID=3115297 RepID=UPI0039063D86
MDKTFRITWHAFLEENNLFEGRSLVKAESEQDAARRLVMEKAREFHIKPHWIQIDTLFEITNE